LKKKIFNKNGEVKEIEKGQCGSVAPFLIFPEQREVDAVVFPVVEEVGVGAVVYEGGVFDDGDACFVEEVVVENGLGHFRNVFQLIGRVGEDDVEFAALEFPAGKESVIFEDFDVPESDFPGSPFDETVMVVIEFYGCHLFGSARSKFVADASRTGK